jgi:hypothetical protein
MARRIYKDREASPRYVYTGHEAISDNYTEITAAERKALRAVKSTDARWLYIELSFFRDFATGIAGLKPKLSSSTLRQTISHKSDIGVKEKRLSNNHIQRWMDQLEKAGLIEDRGNHVYYLPLAPKYPHKEKISNSSCNSSEDLSVTVKQSVTDSQLNNADTPVNAEENEKTELLQKVLQNPSLSQDNPANLSHILLPIQNNNLTKLNYTVPPVDNFLTPDENKFLNLFTDLRLNTSAAGSLKAITTAKALVQSGVTLQEATEAIKIKMRAYYDKYGQDAKTPHPAYFKDAILDYRRDLEAIKQQPNEVNHETNRLRPVSESKADSRRNRYKKILR